MFGPIESVIFDFDGTLVDSLTSVIEGLGAAVEKATGTRPSREELLRTFGPAPKGVLLAWMSEDKIPLAYQAWLDFEKTLTAADYAPFDGIEEMLGALKSTQKKVGVFTGRDRRSTIMISKHHGWLDKYYTEGDMVCGDDPFPHKPQPGALVHLAEKLSLNIKKTMMVGDHEYDVMAGASAGMVTGAALWDLPPGVGTDRSRYKAAWEKWNNAPVSVRLEQPASLTRWLLELEHLRPTT